MTKKSLYARSQV